MSKDSYQFHPLINVERAFQKQSDPAQRIFDHEEPLPQSWENNFLDLTGISQGQLHRHKESYQRWDKLIKLLATIYRRLIGQFDHVLGPLVEGGRRQLIDKLTQGIKSCSEGFHDRVNYIVKSFVRPSTLPEFLTCVRSDLVARAARRLTDEVHADNRVTVIAAADGLGVDAINKSDKYVGRFTDSVIRSMLQEIFLEEYTPARIPSLIVPFLKTECANIGLPAREKGYTSCKIESIGKFLDKIFGQDTANDFYRNYFNIEVIPEDVYESERYASINWQVITEMVFLTLIDQQVVINFSSIKELGRADLLVFYDQIMSVFFAEKIKLIGALIDDMHLRPCKLEREQRLELLACFKVLLNIEPQGQAEKEALYSIQCTVLDLAHIHFQKNKADGDIKLVWLYLNTILRCSIDIKVSLIGLFFNVPGQYFFLPPPAPLFTLVIKKDFDCLPLLWKALKKHHPNDAHEIFIQALNAQVISKLYCDYSGSYEKLITILCEVKEFSYQALLSLFRESLWIARSAFPGVFHKQVLQSGAIFKENRPGLIEDLMLAQIDAQLSCIEVSECSYSICGEMLRFICVNKEDLTRPFFNEFAAKISAISYRARALNNLYQDKRLLFTELNALLQFIGVCEDRISQDSKERLLYNCAARTPKAGKALLDYLLKNVDQFSSEFLLRMVKRHELLDTVIDWVNASFLIKECSVESVQKMLGPLLAIYVRQHNLVGFKLFNRTATQNKNRAAYDLLRAVSASQPLPEITYSQYQATEQCPRLKVLARLYCQIKDKVPQAIRDDTVSIHL